MPAAGPDVRGAEKDEPEKPRDGAPIPADEDIPIDAGSLGTYIGAG